jgi:hypothetical protein
MPFSREASGRAIQGSKSAFLAVAIGKETVESRSVEQGEPDIIDTGWMILWPARKASRSDLRLSQAAIGAEACRKL